MSSSLKGSSIHGALILANSIFGLGSIVGAMGISQDTNPLAFTFVREICSGLLLWALSLYQVAASHSIPAPNDVCSFWRLGFLLFLNQGAYIVGILLAGPVAGSVWQPSAPIITVAISMIGGLEPVNAKRVLGVLIAFGGCAAMVFLEKRDSGEEDSAGGGGAFAFWLGNLLFAINCTATAFYILCSKAVLQNYTALTVTAWSYNLASVFMLMGAAISANIEAADELICPACGYDQGIISIPRYTWPALSYYIVFQSVVSWGLILWANQYATGTLTVGYTVTQPISAIIFTTLFIFVIHLFPSCNDAAPDEKCLNEPGLGVACGIVGVAVGLALVVLTEPAPEGCAASPEEGGVTTEEDPLVSKNGGSDHQSRTAKRRSRRSSIADYGDLPLSA